MCGVRWARKVHVELKRCEMFRGEEFEGKKRCGKGKDSEYDDKTVYRLRDRSGVEGREKVKKREKETFEVYIYLHINLCVCYGLLKFPGSSENHPMQKGRQAGGLKIWFTCRKQISERSWRLSCYTQLAEDWSVLIALQLFPANPL